MSRRMQGVGASPGRVEGVARRLEREIPRVDHRTVAPEEVKREVERFDAARERAREQIRAVREQARSRLGSVEAKIFEPQEMMLDDPDLVEGTLSYIRDNYLAAERAFDWRVTEIRLQFLDAAHGMVIDRLADLRDVRTRVLAHLLDGSDGAVDPLALPDDDETVLIATELTPGRTMQLDPGRIRGILASAGSRASHSAVLARSLGIPAVVGIGSSLDEVPDESRILLDGHVGRIIVDPTADELETFRAAVETSGARRERIRELADRPTRTADGERVVLQANLDQPHDVDAARRVGAEGVGLFRSEFLVIGQRAVPTEEEQVEAYRRVVEAFPDQEVTLRTFDIGGDKFPIFLEAPPEENPFLGWRAIRVCLDRPEMFRRQLRAALRAGSSGSMRLLLPFVVSVSEIRRTREILADVRESLDAGDAGEVPLGAMVETPAAAETVDLLAPHVDFLSLGTNDLTQYTLAADRGNAKLSNLFDPLHPALVRTYRRVLERARDADCEVGVCGELASDPVGVALLLGLGYRKFSLSPSAFPEIKELVLALDTGELQRITTGLSELEEAGEVRSPVERYVESVWSVAPPPTARLSRH